MGIAREPTAAGRRTQVWRGPVAAILIVLGLLLVPLATVTPFVHSALTDTDRFVTQLAPLAENPAVQEALADAAAEALNNRIDADRAVSDAFDAIAELGLSERARAALGLLEAPAAEGLRSLTRDVAARVVSSESFAQAWRQSLLLSHRALLAVFAGGESAIVRVDAETISLDLAPVGAEVRARMLDSGVRLATLIPQDSALTVSIVELEGLGSARALYGVVVAFGPWIPLASVLLLGGGIFASRHRRRALGTVSLSVALLSVLLACALAWSRGYVVGLGVLTPEALGAIFDAAVSPLRGTIVALVIVSGVIAAACWIFGRRAVGRATQAFDGPGEAS